eukprot:5114352-Lingulodinium_polyedra.AAC.1
MCCGYVATHVLSGGLSVCVRPAVFGSVARVRCCAFVCSCPSGRLCDDAFGFAFSRVRLRSMG